MVVSLMRKFCGVWTAERTGDCELKVQVRELPSELLHHRLWLRSLGIGMTPVFMICDTDGHGDLESVDEATASAVFRLHWKRMA